MCIQLLKINFTKNSKKKEQGIEELSLFYSQFSITLQFQLGYFAKPIEKLNRIKYSQMVKTILKNFLMHQAIISNNVKQ